MPLHLRQFTFTLLVLALLTGCQTQPSTPASFEEILAASTFELTAAANTLADIRDAGILLEDSTEYQTTREVLRDAQTYIELAWAYYIDGLTTDAEAARTAAMASYGRIRGALIQYQSRLEAE